MPQLSDSEHDFLAAVRAGESANGYARRNNYSLPWAWKKSKQIRAKLGVHTIGEAIAMSEYAGLEGRIGGLESKLDAAIEALKSAATPAAVETAAGTVRDLRDELRSRGLTEKDLDAAAERKRDELIDTRVQAALDKRDEAARLALEAEEAEEEAARLAEEEANGGGLGARVRDGLGGLRNVPPA